LSAVVDAKSALRSESPGPEAVAGLPLEPKSWPKVSCICIVTMGLTFFSVKTVKQENCIMASWTQF
jgi:hypothetical protein